MGLSQPFRREWFFEERDGTCRLMSSITARLSETGPTWARAVAPMAEWVAQQLWASTRKRTSKPSLLPTRLTQQRKTEGRGREFVPAIVAGPDPEKVCRACGAPALHGQLCSKCGRDLSRNNMIEFAKVGRVAAQGPEPNEKRSQTQLKHKAEQRAWRLAEKPNWLTQDFYEKAIQPRLVRVTISAIAALLDVSVPYAAGIRAGRRRPHPRHWAGLARLVGIKRNSVPLMEN